MRDIEDAIAGQVASDTLEKARAIHDRIARVFWVCAYRTGRFNNPGPASPGAWRISGYDPPPPVPNGQMEWRRPTVFELAWRMSRPDLWADRA